MRKPPHTTIRCNQLWARMYIPEDVRNDFGGKKLLLAKLGPCPMPEHRATALAAIQIAEWKQKIDHARGRAARLDPLIGAEDDVAFTALEVMQEEQLRSVAYRLLARLKASPSEIADEAGNLVSQADGAFLVRLEDWQKTTHLKGKTLDQAVSDIKQFAHDVPETLATLSGRHVQGWIETRLQTVSAETVRRKLSALKSYWGWMQTHEHVSPDRKPFDGRKIQDKRTKVEKALDKRQRFNPEDVVRLMAEGLKDWPLYALIRLGAYTGGRREGLASLKIDSVVTVDGVRSLRLVEKTEAGVRDVPIHPQITDLIDKLVKESKDGYLIHSDAENKYGRRGDALGKRFTRLKNSLGYGEHHTFHSIRHTVVHLFRKAECPVEIRNQILGHEDGDTGEGANYGGHIEQRHKLEWLTKAVSYPQIA